MWLCACSFFSFRLFHFICCVPKNFRLTSREGRRLKFGMLTVLTNIRSTKVLHHSSCIAAGRRLRFGMLTDLTNKRSTKVL